MQKSECCDDMSIDWETLDVEIDRDPKFPMLSPIVRCANCGKLLRGDLHPLEDAWFEYLGW